MEPIEPTEPALPMVPMSPMEPIVPAAQSMRQFFHDIVSRYYPVYTGLSNSELMDYIADLLTRFTTAENLYRIRDSSGRALRGMGEMLAASDPVHGSAPSFDAERAMRRHIGDFALFSAGMYPEAVGRRGGYADSSLVEMVRTGKESYYIVSKFDLFEYEREAPLFARLSGEFERCMYGLTKVRKELDGMGAMR
jgi:hypothetical protein